MLEKIAGTNAIEYKGPAHGAARQECVVGKATRIKVMGVMELSVEMHDTHAS